MSCGKSEAIVTAGVSLVITMRFSDMAASVAIGLAKSNQMGSFRPPTLVRDGRPWHYATIKGMSSAYAQYAKCPVLPKMTNNRTALFIAIMLFICAVPSRAADFSRSEEILAHHLDAIATGPTRTGFKARVVEGTAIYKILAGGTGSIEGKGVVASETNRTRFLFKVVANTYHGEQFICDGSHVDVAATYSDKSRSEFATFIRGQDAPIREGLLGGVLTTAWPLLRSDASKRLTFEGLRKVNGRELLTFRYHPKKSSDLEILIYLDPLSFRHVRTTYHADQAAPISFNDVQSGRQLPARYFLTEEFGQFQTTDGITLPTSYILRFRSEQQALTKEVEWDITVGKVLNNISMDPRNFEIK